MKVVIFAGGFGTRISEESVYKPKPLITLGEKPILWHIMKYYSSYGYNEFIILGGYKQEMIKEYFHNYFVNNCDITFKYDGSSIMTHSNNCEKWTVTVVDTGLNTMTGGRLKRIKNYIGNKPFMLTYGDGLSDVNLTELVARHQKSKQLVTMTVAQPEQRFGLVEFGDNEKVTSFKEKPKNHDNWINAGFFVCEPGVLDYIEGDEMPWEDVPLRTIAASGQLQAYKHTGFFKPMDTLKDKAGLEQIWSEGRAPWKRWS